jgi:hypothetical protein
MNDQDTHHSSRGFVKGVRRAVFSDSAAPPPDTAGSGSVTAVATPSVSSAPAAGGLGTATPSVSSAPTRRKPVGKILFFVFLGLTLAGLVGYSFSMYWDGQQKLKALERAEPQKFAELEAVGLVQRVKRHMLLPDEVPLVNTVTDVGKLKVEPFYANASEGDKVLVFSTRAILYNPSRDQIIEIGFIRRTTPTPVAAGETASASGEPSVAGAATSPGKILINTENP